MRVKIDVLGGLIDGLEPIAPDFNVATSATNVPTVSATFATALTTSTDLS